jgi:hypothetical protein
VAVNAVLPPEHMVVVPLNDTVGEVDIVTVASAVPGQPVELEPVTR